MGLIRILFFVFFVILTYSTISIQGKSLGNLPPMRADVTTHDLAVTPIDIEHTQKYTKRATLEMGAEEYWRHMFPGWTLELSKTLGSPPVPVDYTDYEYLARINIILRAGIREVYVSPYRKLHMPWLQKLALTISTPMSIPQRGNFPNGGKFGERGASEKEYTRLLGTSGNFLGTRDEDNFLSAVDHHSPIFDGAFRDKLVRYYSRHHDPILDLRGEELRMGLYSTYRLYLLNFSTELHRTISLNHPIQGEPFQALVDRTWFAATSQWLQSGRVDQQYQYLGDLLGEVYGPCL